MKSIISIILIIASFGLYFLFTKGEYGKVKNLKAEEVNYQDAFLKSKELLARRDELLQKYNAISSADLLKLEKLLPDTVDSVRLILDMNNMASSFGLALKNIKLSGNGEAKNKVKEAGAAVNLSDKKYNSISLSFSVDSTYNTFRSFIEEIEKSLRIMDIQDLNLQEKTSALRAGEPAYRFDITIKTYWLK